MKKVMINLCTFIITLIVVLLVCEGVFRYIVPPPYRARNIEFYNTMYQSDSVLGYTVKPNINNEHVHTNSYGFRGKEIVPHRINIICVGDSHTFGWEVDDAFSYPQQLQDLLGEKFNVINMGLGGYNILRQIAFLNRYIKEFKPRLVVFGVVVDDIYPDLPATPFNSDSQKKLFFNTQRKSALLSYIKDLWPGIKIKLGLQKSSEDLYFDAWSDKEKLAFYKKEIEKEIPKWRNLNIKVIFVIFPFYSQVYSKNKETWPNVELFRNLESKDLKYIDLLPTFKAHYKKFSSIYLEDGHPNGYGYKLIAQEIFKKTKEEKLLGLSEALE